ncbi:MAG: metal-dependent hydrolase [Candidatus Aminicenantes bacterium]|jgi:inner membrane protein
MDSLTQATLGAAVAHACWHRQLGRSALLWGAALGILPDLDVLVYPVLDNIQKLYWHRGESHSLFFAVIGSLLLGWLFRKTRWKEKLPIKRAVMGIFLIFLTHYAIDFFNIYGTQLLAPFSHHGFSLGNMFVIDPLYTVPLLAGIIIAGIKKGRASLRATWTGLIISLLYVLFSLGAHTYADQTFKRQLAARNIEVQDSLTGATPMNTLLWRHVARTREGILIGYFSIIADSPEKEIRFDRIPRNENLVEPYRGQRNLKVVEWFSQGFWVARKTDKGLIMADIRFGELRFKPDDPPDRWRYIFAWEITDNPDTFIPQPRQFDRFGEALGILWKQLIEGQPD